MMSTHYYRSLLLDLIIIFMIDICSLIEDKKCLMQVNQTKPNLSLISKASAFCMFNALCLSFIINLNLSPCFLLHTPPFTHTYTHARLILCLIMVM